MPCEARHVKPATCCRVKLALPASACPGAWQTASKFCSGSACHPKKSIYQRVPPPTVAGAGAVGIKHRQAVVPHLPRPLKIAHCAAGARARQHTHSGLAACSRVPGCSQLAQEQLRMPAQPSPGRPSTWQLTRQHHAQLGCELCEAGQVGVPLLRVRLREPGAASSCVFQMLTHAACGLLSRCWSCSPAAVSHCSELAAQLLLKLAKQLHQVPCPGIRLSS